MFSPLICNKSSIDATYSSNHTLQHICVAYSDPYYSYPKLPIELYSMLHANICVDKRAVACKKSVLPLALSRFGNSDIHSGLSLVCGILRKLPYLIQKRKLNDIS